MAGLTETGRNPLQRLSRFASTRKAHARRLTQQLSVRFGDVERPSHPPTFVQIEATSRCNLRCPSCPHASDAGGMHLTPDRLRAILDRLPFSPRRVRLSGVGEPLLNPAFPELLDALAERGLACDFITNGTLLNAENRERLHARKNIEGIVVSCDGATKDTFEKSRRGADFDRWQENVRAFVAETTRRRVRPVAVSSSTVINRDSHPELEAILRMVASFGFAEATFLQPAPVVGVDPSVWATEEQMAAVRHSGLEALGTALGVKVSLILARDKQPPEAPPGCLQPWENIFVRADGSVEPCCALHDNQDASVGNLLDHGFEDVWHGSAYAAFRSASVAGTNARCLACPYY